MHWADCDEEEGYWEVFLQPILVIGIDSLTLPSFSTAK